MMVVNSLIMRLGLSDIKINKYVVTLYLNVSFENFD